MDTIGQVAPYERISFPFGKNTARQVIAVQVNCALLELGHFRRALAGQLIAGQSQPLQKRKPAQGRWDGLPTGCQGCEGCQFPGVWSRSAGSQKETGIPMLPVPPGPQGGDPPTGCRPTLIT